MKTTFYDIGDYIIMEVFTGSVYEYYARTEGDPFDYFRFMFGIDKPMSKEELESLQEIRYFDN